MAVDRDNDPAQVTKQRTLQQNRALHLMLKLIADSLNESGWDMKRTLKAEIDIPWSVETVKEYIWRPIQKAQLMKESTTELTTKDIDKVVDTVTRHLGEVTGVQVEFPSIDHVIKEQQAKEKSWKRASPSS